MKTRVIAIMCCVALALSCVAIAGCGGNSGSSDTADLSNSAYVGTWKVTKAIYNGEEVPASEVFKNGDVTMTLNADGTLEFVGEGETSTATWTEAKDGGIETKGDVNMKFKDTDGMLEGEVIGMHLFFEKQA